MHPCHCQACRSLGLRGHLQWLSALLRPRCCCSPAGANSSLATKRLTYLGYTVNELAVTLGGFDPPLVLRSVLVRRGVPHGRFACLFFFS